MRGPCLSLVLATLSWVVPGTASGLEFNRDIRPILADRCFQCHGADKAARKAKLRLDLPASAYAERDGVIAIVPGAPEKSELVRRITSSDLDEQMPPRDHPIQLDGGQRDILVQWIAEGAKYEGHWAFLPPSRDHLSKTPDGSGGQQEIDRLVKARLAGTGTIANGRATRETLIRRLSLDLTGLPPTPEEVAAFVADRSPRAYAKVVDRLLASPRYGERMAMWWLDGARYADSHGFQADWERYQWPWRDWVISAFNRNLPFDQFTIEQLAGDMLPNATNEQIVATGFNRNHRINTEGGSLNEEWLVENVIDRVETMGSVWLGLTLGCARCHDHKYDPISQKEFYELFAFFNNVPEQGKGPGKQGNFDPVIKVENRDKGGRGAELAEKIARAEAALKERERIAIASLKPQPEKEAPEWRVVRKMEIVSEGGTEFRPESDGSFKAHGANPKRDRYTITIGSKAGTVAGILLEAIPDPSFSTRSFTRGHNGNFVLSTIRARVAGKQTEAIKISEAIASYEQSGWPVKNSLNNQGASGWAVDGQEHHVARRAMFKFASPVTLSGNEKLVIEMAFQAFDYHAIGRFRLSLTAHPGASLQGETAVSPEVVAALATPHQRRSARQLKILGDHLATNPPSELVVERKAIARLKAEREALNKSSPTVMVMQEMKTPRESFVLIRGEYDARGEKVTAALPAAFPPLPEGAPANRLGLAQWIVSGDHPLTARVQVNRIWELLFGVALVKTSENLGTQADWPSHPELLDWLASEFVRLEWDVKALLKTMVMSETYQRSSAMTKESYARDPENRLLARGPRFRVQAEMVRDQALYLGGLLNEQLGGPSVRPYQPAGIWSEFNFYGNLRNYKHDTGPGLYRRSLYTIWKRTAAPPGMTLFDMPNREICIVKRSRTNTPLQALALLNDVTYVEASRKFAERMMREGGSDLEGQIAFGFRCAVAREASREELALLRSGHERRLRHFAGNPGEAHKLLAMGEAKVSAGLDPIKLAALTTTASVILNLDETITKE